VGWGGVGGVGWGIYINIFIYFGILAYIAILICKYISILLYMGVVDWWSGGEMSGG
jgi:hypothetical protein